MDRYLKASLCHHPPSNTLRNIILYLCPLKCPTFNSQPFLFLLFPPLSTTALAPSLETLNYRSARFFHHPRRFVFFFFFFYPMPNMLRHN